MRHPTIERMVEMALADSDKHSPGWWWLSYADGALPKGSQFIGVVVVRARGFMMATMLASMKGQNPGGECRGMQIPTETPPPKELLTLVRDKDRIAELEAQWARSSGKMKEA